jgi:predicted metal-dependent peptidase
VIASLSGRLLYIEVKTSPPGRIESPEIGAFAGRILDIAPDIAIFNNDTHLRMKDKIVPLMEKGMEQAKAQSPKAKEGTDTKPLFERLEREIFHLKGAVYIINSKPDLKLSTANLT